MDSSGLVTPNFKPQSPVFNGYLIIGDALSFHGKITEENLSDLGDWELEQIKTVEAVKEHWNEKSLKALQPYLDKLPKIENWTFHAKDPLETTSKPKRLRTEKKCPPAPRKKKNQWISRGELPKSLKIAL